MKSHTYVNENRNNLNILALIILFCLLALGTLNSVTGPVSTLGLFSLLILLGFSNSVIIIRLLKTKQITYTHSIILFIAIIFSVLSLISALINQKPFEITNTLQFISCVLFGLYISTIVWTKYKIKLVYILVTLYISLHFIIWILSGFPQLFTSFYPNSNTFGPYIFLSLYFIFFKIQQTKFTVIDLLILMATLVLILASDARSILISAIIGLFIFIFWKIISRSKFIATIVYMIAIIIILSMIFVYPQLPQWQYFHIIEEWMLETFNKSLMSGREEIWIVILELINQKPFFGYGPDAIPAELIYENYSTHNLYLNIAMQSGILGLIIFIVLFYAIFITFVKSKESKTVRLAVAFLFTILVHQFFEITLIQNQLSIGLIQWTIIGIGLGFATNNLNKRLEDN